MKRKEFLQKTSLLAAGAMTVPLVSCKSAKKEIATSSQVSPTTNWAGNYTYKSQTIHKPESISELQELMKQKGKTKALGSQHCFNDIADTQDFHLSTSNLNKVIDIDKTNKTVTVEAGARYGDFSERLHEEGYALHNLASLPHISVAGACATATHGSGVKNQNLPSSVVEFELLTPQGELLTLDKTHPDFAPILVGLGAFGIITKLKLEVQDTFEVSQFVFQDAPFTTVKETFDELMSSGYSVSLFTNWIDNKVSEIWVKRRVDQQPGDMEDTFFGGTAATENLHPVVDLSAESCSEQLGVPGPWYNRLPHFKMGFTPSSGDELQAEYFVPREQAVDALSAVENLKDEIYSNLIISEVRTIAADDFWLSPCYQQDSVAIHFTLKPKPKEVMALLPKIEAALAPHNVKPHWGKLFTIDKATLKSRYDKFDDFVALAKKYDPEGKMRNAYLDKNIY